MIPTSWENGFAAGDANPRSRAPLLAIALALRERYAALGKPGRRSSATIDNGGILEPMPGAAMVFPELGQNQTIERILLSIRELQGLYYNPVPPYGDCGFSKFPDTLASRYGIPSDPPPSIENSLTPYDALALMPPPGTPLPGDSTASAATRAFYAWARDSINQMSMVVLDRKNVMSTVYYAVNQNDVDEARDLAYFLGAARRTEGVLSRSPGFAVSGYYDPIGDFYWDEASGHANVKVQNPYPLEAKARIVLCADWPLNEWIRDGYSVYATGFDTFGAPASPEGWGPSSEIGGVIAPGEWILVWPDSGSFPVPSVHLPGRSERRPGESLHYYHISQSVKFLLDFSDSFRFKGAGVETP